MAREKREVEGSEVSASSPKEGRFKERNFCFDVEVGVELLLDSGSRMVRTVDRD
jgi:hypothetical protein